AAGSDADINAELSQRAGIKLYRPGKGWREGAIQRPLRAKDQAHTAGNVARKLADLSPLLCRRGTGDGRSSSRNHLKFSAFSHERPPCSPTLCPSLPRMRGRVRVGVGCRTDWLKQIVLSKITTPDFLYDITQTVSPPLLGQIRSA